MGPSHVAGGAEVVVRTDETGPAETVDRTGATLATLELPTQPAGPVVYQPKVELAVVAYPVVLRGPAVPDDLDSARGTLGVLEAADSDESADMTLSSVLVRPTPVRAPHHSTAHVQE